VDSAGVFNLCQHFEILYSRYANKHYITGVYIAINDIYREVVPEHHLEQQPRKLWYRNPEKKGKI
jgi:hypothetical protein